ncbi:hypothetical protein BpHYR1_027616 [Brachionus plicatilis]|uniref:Uncharacterized protein n=1 Tax=Brachionus plicatilis TaxID=10195 RepID=A0A3M7S457_BRAPC|nr:hypothetical protein BpHYR1_027616 [Brachionus plicatilis]
MYYLTFCRRINDSFCIQLKHQILSAKNIIKERSDYANNQTHLNDNNCFKLQQPFLVSTDIISAGNKFQLSTTL